MAKAKREKSKYTLSNSGTDIRVTYGYVNPDNQKTIFIEGKTWVVPTDGDIDENVKKLKKVFKKSVNKHILSCSKFSPIFMSILNLPTYSMKIGKKKFMDFEIIMRKNDEYQLKELIPYIEEISKNIVYDIDSCMKKNCIDYFRG